MVENFAGRLAVVTGGGTGMGRELVIQLAGEGRLVATCDLSEDVISDTAEPCSRKRPQYACHPYICDTSDVAQVERFRDEVVA